MQTEATSTTTMDNPSFCTSQYTNFGTDKTLMMARSEYIDGYDSSSDEEDDDEDLERGIRSLKKSQHKGWNVLKKHLREGTLLLRANSQGEYRSAKSIRRAMMDEFHEGMYFSINSCLMAIGIYLVVSIAMYTFVLEPKWTMIDSCYFAVTTFTTLGYGDLAPSNTASMVFTCIYAVTGVACLGVSLGVLGNHLIQKHDVMIEQYQNATQEEVMTLFGETSSDISSSSTRSWWSLGNGRTTSNSERSKVAKFGEGLCGGGTWEWKRFIWMLLAVFVMVCTIAIGSGWDALSTIYYFIVTSCTIGYGDYVPTTQFERLVAVVYIPLACLIMGHWMGYVASKIIEIQSSRFRIRHMDRRELTQDDLDAMDLNGNGKVSWAEFLEFMLVAMEKVDYELLDELHTYFRKLDVARTGELSRDDLVEAARRKLRGVRHKLKLASYKQELINRGKHPVRRHVTDTIARVAQSVHETYRNISQALFDEGEEEQEKNNICDKDRRSFFKSFRDERQRGNKLKLLTRSFRQASGSGLDFFGAPRRYNSSSSGMIFNNPQERHLGGIAEEDETNFKEQRFKDDISRHAHNRIEGKKNYIAPIIANTESKRLQGPHSSLSPLLSTPDSCLEGDTGRTSYHSFGSLDHDITPKRISFANNGQ